MTRLSIELDGERISYLHQGQGPPLLLLHRLGLSGDSWNMVIGPLSRDWSVYAPDMKGHGDSAKPPGNYLIEDYARDVEQFSERLGLGQVILCGNSVGALIALETAATCPERVKALVLVNCPGWDAWDGIERLMLSALHFDTKGNPLPVTSDQLSHAFVRVTPELIDWVNQQRAKAGVWVKKTMIAIALYQVIPKLPLVKCPCLVVSGSDDLLREHEMTLVRGIGNAKHAVIPEAGNVPQMDNPNRFLREVRRFLSTVSP